MIILPYLIPPGAENARPFWFRDLKSTSGAAATHTLTVNNNQQWPLLLTHVATQLIAGAAQFPRISRIWVVDPANVALFYIGGKEFFNITTAALAGIHAEECEIVVPPRYGVRAAANFDAGAASNSLELSMHGWLIPRGTLSIAG